MNASRVRTPGRTSLDPHELRDQEVLRANRELAAYFKGRRTEREARAALKTVKAFIRDRERLDPAKRRPLPGASPERNAKKAGIKTRKRKGRRAGTSGSRRAGREAQPAPPTLGPSAGPTDS
jgi:hypothetical protein